MSRREAKLLARSWAEDPGLLAQDLSELLRWVNDNILHSASASLATGDSLAETATDHFAEALRQLVPLDDALVEYRRMMSHMVVPDNFLLRLIEMLRDSSQTSPELLAQEIRKVDEHVQDVRRWAQRQAKTSDISPRSDRLQANIEQLDDELLIRTDQDGSMKLRGSANIPMFLAFWQAPGHRLSAEAFRNLDPSSKPKGLERHRVRLSAQLQKVLIELVAEDRGYRMQRCRNR